MGRGSYFYFIHLSVQNVIIALKYALLLLIKTNLKVFLRIGLQTFGENIPGVLNGRFWRSVQVVRGRGTIWLRIYPNRFMEGKQKGDTVCFSYNFSAERAGAVANFWLWFLQGFFFFVKLLLLGIPPPLPSSWISAYTAALGFILFPFFFFLIRQYSPITEKVKMR